MGLVVASPGMEWWPLLRGEALPWSYADRQEAPPQEIRMSEIESDNRRIEGTGRLGAILDRSDRCGEQQHDSRAPACRKFHLVRPR